MSQKRFKFLLNEIKINIVYLISILFLHFKILNNLNICFEF